MADFAPYQDQSPDTTRALSPVGSPLQSPRLAAADRPRNAGSAATAPPAGEIPPQEPERVAWNAVPSAFGGRREDVDVFETKLGLRMDYEACLAYLLLPPAGGVLLLMLEHRSDYVRFHAWQSSLLFAFIFVLHIVFSWSSIISWLMLVCDIGLIAFLTLHAYRDAATFDRYEVPFLGPLASSILDNE